MHATLSQRRRSRRSQRRDSLPRENRDGRRGGAGGSTGSGSTGGSESVATLRPPSRILQHIANSPDNKPTAYSGTYCTMRLLNVSISKVHGVACEKKTLSTELARHAGARHTDSIPCTHSMAAPRSRVTRGPRRVRALEAGGGHVSPYPSNGVGSIRSSPNSKLACVMASSTGAPLAKGCERCAPRHQAPLLSS